ncbi:MAG: hypothetical protein FJ009_20325 [Chloroflexi bacterium]|nr:hypothetical protein [Chloroflexota bacterium]
MQTKYNRKAERAQVRRKDGREIGGITGDVFHKTVQASKHFLHTPPAIAFDLDVIAQAKANGARFVEVLDSETGRVFRATIDRVWKRGFTFERKHGRQIGLALDQWNRDAEPPIADQLTLWGQGA